MRLFVKSVQLFCFLISSIVVCAQQTRKWGDQGNGTYSNPILPGDFQNTDVIRVGDTYHYIGATKEMSPGMMMMSSKDMVNWKYIGHAVADITQISSNYNYDKMQGASRGIWAGAIRYHNKKFFVYFTDPDHGLFMTTAKKAEGPWEPLTQVMKAPGWDDPCPLWDDDGQAYLVMTHFADNYKIHLFKMSQDGKTLDMKSDSVIHQSKGSEANKLYKINDWYYHFYSEVTSTGRMPFMTRSRNIYGPYETRRQLINPAEAEPNQGGMLQTKKGDWYFVTHHGKAYWCGREVSLLPITWTDGWPVWGTPDKNGIGTMLWSSNKPIAGAKVKPLQTSDEFSSNTLSRQWEWYFHPRNDKWSLKERKGYLRLYACKPLQAGAINKTANVLTQRPLRVSQNTATVEMDISNMKDGQVTGLTLFGKTTAVVGVRQVETTRFFYFSENGKMITNDELPIEGKTIWLRATWDVAGLAHFFYSIDGKDFSAIGTPYQITNFGNFLGAKLSIFTANDKEEEDTTIGFLDVNWFHYDAK